MGLKRRKIGICIRRRFNYSTLTRHVEVIVWKRAVDSLLGHQHEVGGVCLGDALADVPGASQI